jgi:uridine phosphorylase
LGSLIIADAAVRLDGTSRQYAVEGYPAAATPEVVLALKDAAAALGKKATVGVAASTDSFYVGQGRPGFGGYFPSKSEPLLKDLQQARVLCFEMESSTLFTLGRIFGLKTGAVFAVVANRVSDKMVADAGTDDAIAVAIEAVKRLPMYGI